MASKENAPWFRVPGYRSVDEEGRLPPGQKPFGNLPPGVKPAVSPEDRERLLLQGDVVTVPKTESIEKNMDVWYRLFDWKNDWLWFSLNRIPDKFRQIYNSMSLSDTEPMYHTRLPEIPPVWDCDVTDVLCAAAADRRAIHERKVEFHMLKTIANRLEYCHRMVGNQEWVQMYKNEAYDVQCGPLDETLREMEAAYALKWDRLFSINPHMNLARKAYFKQKNRYIEDRFRHRMMANVGAKPNTDEVSEEGRWHITDVDERSFKEWGILPRITSKGFEWDGHFNYKFDFPDPKEWDLNDALLKEAQKRQKARMAAAEE